MNEKREDRSNISAGITLASAAVSGAILMTEIQFRNLDLFISASLSLIPAFGGMGEMILMGERAKQLNKREFRRWLDKKKSELSEKVINSPKEQFLGGLKILRELFENEDKTWNFDDINPVTDRGRKVVTMVREVYESRARKEGL